MIVGEALREASRRLETVSDTARLDAELLMAEALGVARSDLLLRHMQVAAPHQFTKLVDRRLLSEPIAYILGRQEFYGREFAVDDRVLIPRSDSETVVVAALEACREPARVLDCGTGSGALLLTVLAERPGAAGIGVDRSVQALEVAAGNAARLGLAPRATFARCDWREAGWSRKLGRFDLILANPPYVEAGADLDPSVAEWEPAEALFAGEDGLDDYRQLVPQLAGLLTASGRVVLEIGASQGEPVERLAQASGFSAAIVPDLAGRPRAMVLAIRGWQTPFE